MAVYPHPSGNALRVAITPPAGALAWRVLRKVGEDQAFTGPADPASRMLVDGSTDETILDVSGLENGTAYTYGAFYATPSGFMATPDLASASPAPTYLGVWTDPLTIVRRRIEDGLAVELARKTIVAGPSGKVPVLTAPFALEIGVTFPNVSIHLDSANSAQRAVGDHISVDGDDRGWLESTRLAIICTSKSTDDRTAIRMAIKRILLANIEVFDALGLNQIEVSWSEMEDLFESNVPLFMTAFSFTCLSPALVDLNEPDGFSLGAITATTAN